MFYNVLHLSLRFSKTLTRSLASRALASLLRCSFLNFWGSLHWSYLDNQHTSEQIYADNKRSVKFIASDLDPNKICLIIRIRNRIMHRRERQSNISLFTQCVQKKILREALIRIRIQSSGWIRIQICNRIMQIQNTVYPQVYILDRQRYHYLSPFLSDKLFIPTIVIC